MIGDVIMNKRWVRNLITVGIPTIIGSFSIIIASDFMKPYIGIFITLTIILMLTNIGFVFYYSSVDVNVEFENNKLKTLLNTVNKISRANSYICSSISEFTEPWAANINKMSKSIQNKGELKVDDWNLLKIYKEICISCRNMVKEFTGIDDNSKVSVGFISYYIHDDVEYVRMDAHSNPQTTRPGIFDIEEKLADCTYQYAKLIKRNDTEIYVLENNDEIQKHFDKKHPYTDLSKYSQYIAVPIFCSRNKILGILQIVTKNDYVILENKKDLQEFGEKYVIPYTDFILLAHKIQKSLFSKPADEEDNSEAKI